MRWFFFVLILANVVAAYWFSVAENHRAGQREKKQEQVEKKSGSANTLVLLSERGSEILTPAEEMEAMLLTVAPRSVERELPEPDMEPVVPSLEADAIPAEQRLNCALIGPFIDRSLVMAIQTRIASLNLEAGLLQSEREIRQDYWVIIPPQVMKAEAKSRHLLLGLREKNIDSYLIEDGEYQYGITLGVFSNKDNVEEYHGKISAQGYEAEVKLLPRMVSEYWLELLEQDARSLSDELWVDIEQLSGAEVIGAKYGFCGEVSSNITPLSESE